MHRGLRLAALAAFAFAMIFAGGCADDTSTRSVVSVVSINANRPLQSDVRGLGDDPLDPTDDTITDDIVEITLANYPHDNALKLAPGYPFGDVIFTEYSVTFIRGDGDGPAPSPFSGAMYLKVPNAQPHPNEYVPPTGYILMVPGSLKLESPLDDLAYGGGQINATACVEFIGRETTSNDVVKTTATLSVNFANYVDVDD
jgi:hypothetical protein